MNILSTEVQSIIVFLSQIVFIYLRTVNVKAISEGKLLMAIISGNAQAMAGLISFAIGIYSIIDLNILPVIAYLLGGTVGTFLAMKKTKLETTSIREYLLFFTYWINPNSILKREVKRKDY